jgi:polar amino acid transport system substrate-binding protein
MLEKAMTNREVKDKPLIKLPAIAASRRSALLLGAATLLSFGLPRITRAKVASLIVNYYNDFPPFSYVDSQGKMTGFFVDCLEEVLNRRCGIALTHRGLPWARAQQEVKDSQADAFLTFISDARREYVHFSSEVVLERSNGIVFAKNNPNADRIRKIATPEDLKQFSVGTYYGDSRLDTLFTGMSVDLATDLTQVLKKIEAGRVDLAVTNNWQYFARLANILDKFDSVPFGPLSKYYFGVRKSHPDCIEILHKFDKALVATRADGTLGRIITSHGL